MVSKAVYISHHNNDIIESGNRIKEDFGENIKKKQNSQQFIDFFTIQYAAVFFLLRLFQHSFIRFHFFSISILKMCVQDDWLSFVTTRAS